jgi:ribosomal protein S6--L-glutamate ligase
MPDGVKIVVGSEEWCAFPRMGIPAIKMRVDSGAKTSSLHAFNIQQFKRNGQAWVSFEVHPLQNDRQTVVRCERPVIARRAVKSSSGISETRYVISATMRVAAKDMDIELTLANRDTMGYRMLLGREAMSGAMLVDPAKHFCMGEITHEQLIEYYGKGEGQNGGLKIGLMAGNQRLYSNQRILEAGEERGHEMVFLNTRQTYMKLDSVVPEAHYHGGKHLDDLDAIITRIRPSLTLYGCALARQFESMGVYTLNSSAAITQSRNKLLSLQLMLKHGVKIPKTAVANSPMETSDLIKMVDGVPLIIKLLADGKGNSAVLAETKKQATGVINSFRELKTNLLVQEFIKEADNRDLHCFIVDGKVVAAIQREAAPGEFRANLKQGGVISVTKISAKEKSLAIKAAKTLGLRVATVDIVRSARGPLVVNINPVPGLEDIETATGKDIAGMIISSVEKRLGWKTAPGNQFQKKK